MLIVWPTARVLGSFQLDKNTNCGDTLLVGEREFEVVTARSQFKYAGGKRFVMTRKILEVKEITSRLQQCYQYTPDQTT
ncbi:hypothetical protein THAOC_22141 [Thalassiosira oceanica]|uniref:Uncharacterized protein n=1 Tax=Thalassiosira oceanica TaxID=159749 RepID=K0SGY1_THAOC|nr:hypothetical protein THAOC_22141 [Thalassiosira oceanica]|eukprot:EJK57782.1 hypothetical protein THAOC_22141 [Thalassiosira oceanica]